MQGDAITEQLIDTAFEALGREDVVQVHTQLLAIRERTRRLWGDALWDANKDAYYERRAEGDALVPDDGGPF